METKTHPPCCLNILLGLAMALSLLPACAGGNDDDDSNAPIEAPLDKSQRREMADRLKASLGDAGFEVREGRHYYFRVEDCEHLPSCYGNNPTSPYGLYLLPALPGEAESDAIELASLPQFDGLSPVWRLRPDEALVYIGRTPPNAAYFSFRSYLFRSGDPADGTRNDIFASLGDATNNTFIATSGTPGGTTGDPFLAETAVITATDRGVEQSVRDALAAAGFPLDWTNTDVIAPEDYGLRMGLGAADDSFMMLDRVALFEDAAEGEQYMADPPAIVLRVTPKSPPTPKPFSIPALKPRGTGTDESALQPALEALAAAVRDQLGEPVRERTVIPITLEGPRCIEQKTSCLGDVRDTLYFAQLPFEFPESGRLVAVGVNHEASGKATYSNIVVMYRDKLMGVTYADSREMAGSADRWIPDHPDRDKMFAYAITRDCGGEPYCLEVPTEFPGVPVGGQVTIVFRAYIEPGRTVSPSVEEVLKPMLFEY